MIEWHITGIPFTCHSCKKDIKPNRRVGFNETFMAYCWRCARNIELAEEHKFEAKVDREALLHLGMIKGKKL